MLALLTDEQQMLKQMVSELSESSGLTNPSDLEISDRPKTWSELASAGLLALRQREASGDPAASAVEVAIVAEELASRLVPVPYLGSAVLAMELLALAGAPETWLDEIASGEIRYGILLTADLSGPASSGTASAVAWDTDGADYIVAFDGAGSPVVRLATGEGLQPLDGVDLTRQIAELSSGLAGEELPRQLSPDDYDRWLALALTALSADMVGAMRGALGRVIAYSKDRVQFGVPIGSFQAVQHLCAEALVKIEATASVTKYAAWAVDELPPAEALLAARTAKAYACSVARDVPETVMQVYGGIGQTWENIAHFYLRRALLDRSVLGDEEAQLAAIADSRLGGR